MIRDNDLFFFVIFDIVLENHGQFLILKIFETAKKRACDTRYWTPFLGS